MDLEQKFLRKVILYLFIIRIKIFILAPHDDTSINNIIVGIGAVVVILIVLLIIIKLIYKCYRMYKSDDDDDDTKDSGMF